MRIEAPGIDLAVRPLTDATVALAKLERGELDALIGGHLPESPRCVRHRLFEERFVCVRDARTNRSERLSLKDYATLPHALFSAGRRRWPAERDRRAAGAPWTEATVAVTLAHVVAVPFAVAGTDLIATMAERVARRFTHLADIAVVAPPIDIPAFAIDLIHPSRAARDPALRWFLDAVDRCAGSIAILSG
ncbi:LysR substrate-binding domain-containing protein [Bradyrhizobium elkanii]|nr:LysR substrate-binding domain-containing protein [Bradyrhizobium elkanii]